MKTDRKGNHHGTTDIPNGQNVVKLMSHSVEETMALGRKLGLKLQTGDVILLVGEMGTGKTVLAKGLVSALTNVHQDDVTSPSFTLMHSFEGPVPVTHIDLYRLNDPSEIFELGIGETMDESILVIEWGEKIIGYFENPVIVQFRWIDQTTREIEIVLNKQKFTL